MDDRDRTYLQTPEQWARFVSAFVHELRTPLASLRMLADLLTDAPQGHLGEQERRYTENILAVVQDLQALLGDVAELARLLAGRALVRPEEVDLRQLVDQAEQTIRSQAWEGGIVLTDSLDPALPRRFRTDPDRLRKLLVLLLAAAVSQAKSEVFVRLDIEGGNLRAAISSDGLPFPEADPQTFFEPFNEAMRSVRQRTVRSLALPLANELTQALGGTLRTENHGGRPAFDLSLPAAS